MRLERELRDLQTARNLDAERVVELGQREKQARDRCKELEAAFDQVFFIFF